MRDADAKRISAFPGTRRRFHLCRSAVSTSPARTSSSKTLRRNPTAHLESPRSGLHRSASAWLRATGRAIAHAARMLSSPRSLRQGQA